MLKLITTNQFKLLLCTFTLVLMQLVSFGQTREIRGTVKDKLGETLPGATINVKGTNNTVVTGNDGSFVISAPNGSVLTIKFVGYTPEEVKIGETNNYNIVLSSDNVLNDVVVVGYGAQRKRDVTGATSTVSAKEIMQNPVMSPEQALQGRAAGVRVMQSNGAPGGAVQVQIRGISSTSASNQPLYVLDGIPLFDAGGETTGGAGGVGSPASNLGSPIANLNPNDIESMEVLKDASSTAIYGARASNGVILITTKRGKAGKTKFSFDYYNGIQQLTQKLDLINGTEGMMIRNRALLNTTNDFNRNIEPESFNPFSFATSPTFKNTDWQNELFRTAGIQDANLSASGGTDKVKYMVSANYFSQEGIVINTKMDRISTRINLDFVASDKLKFGTSTALSYQYGNNALTDNPFQGSILSSITGPGYNAAYNADGSYFGPLQNTNFWTSARNGVFETVEFTQNIKRSRATSNIYGELEILKGLKFKSTFGVDFTLLDQRRRNPSIPRGPQLIINGPDIAPNGLQRVSRQNRQGLNWVAEQVLSYSTSFNKIHQLDGLIGFSAQSFTNQSLSSRGDGSLNPLLTVIGGNLNTNFTTSESFAQNGLVSQFARINYSLLGRYLFTGNVRRDGSSNFGPANRYGVFPSASVGWRVSDEPFFEPVKSVVNELKFRASYGITGNQDIGAFNFISRVGAASAAFGNTVAQGTIPSNFANANLRWEENEQTDIGVELGLLKGRINIAADYYVKNANGLLFNQGLPITSGFGGVQGNLGKIQNKGFEFTINTFNLTGPFKWNTNFNISTLDNKVISLGDNLGTGINQIFGYGITGFANQSINVTRVGLPMATFIGFRSNGLYQTVQETIGAPSRNGVIPQPGDLRVVDISGPNGVPDGIINLDDREIQGSPFPDFFGGLSNDFSYKNFSLNIFATFSKGNKIFNQQRLQLEQGLNEWGAASNLNAWSGPGTSNDFPRLAAGAQSQENRITLDRWLEDGSFIRIRNLTLGYNVPQKLLGKIKVQSLRIYSSVSNVVTFTKYTGWDPEINSSGSDVLSSGIDQTGYPLSRTFQLGLNLGF